MKTPEGVRRLSLVVGLVLAVAACKGATGPAGLVGPQGGQGTEGTQGVQGVEGLAGISGLEIVRSTSNVSPAVTTTTAECPSSKKVIAGGFALSSTDVQIPQSYPFETGGREGWAIVTFAQFAQSFGVTVYAICVNAPASSPGPDPLLAAPAIKK